jgi:hypothetical protein
MGLIGWLRSVGFLPTSIEGAKQDQASPQSSNPAIPPAPFPEGWGPLSAVGESQYQPALRRVAKSGRVCWATLLAEPDNPFDSNAVAVQIQGATVAYLSRTDARRYQSRLRTLTEPMRVPAKLTGGTGDKPSFGVVVDCRELEAMPKPKARRKRPPAADPADQPF